MFLKKDSGRDGYIPVISKKEDDLPEFSLKDGNVTTADESLGAYYAAVTLPLPPPLLSVVFGKEVAGKNGAEVIFITRTRSDGSGREVRRLFFLDGRELMTRKAFRLGDENWMVSKQKLKCVSNSARGQSFEGGRAYFCQASWER